MLRTGPLVPPLQLRARRRPRQSPATVPGWSLVGRPPGSRPRVGDAVNDETPPPLVDEDPPALVETPPPLVSAPPPSREGGTPAPPRLGPVDPTLAPEVAALVGLNVEAVAGDIAAMLGVVDAALAVVYAFVDVDSGRWPSLADALARIHRDRVAELVEALARAGFLDRDSTLYPAAITRLSPPSTPTTGT
jgi:hypothetical protein